MPSLNFQPRFMPAIQNGLAEILRCKLPFPEVRPKRQTIRPVRKVPIKAGDSLFLFTKMRTPYCRRLGTVRCESVTPITLSWSNREAGIAVVSGATADGAEALAERDGFSSLAEMLGWFEAKYTLPFSGVLIRW